MGDRNVPGGREEKEEEVVEEIRPVRNEEKKHHKTPQPTRNLLPTSKIIQTKERKRKYETRKKEEETEKEAEEKKRDFIWNKWGLTRNGPGQPSPKLNQSLKKRKNKKETPRKQLKVKEMILDIQKKEEKEAEKVELAAKKKKDELTLDPEDPKFHRLLESRNSKGHHNSFTREEKEPDGRKFNLGTSIHPECRAEEKENKIKLENDQTGEKRARKKKDVKELIGIFGGIGAGKRTDKSMENESESIEELKDNCLGLSWTGKTTSGC